MLRAVFRLPTFHQTGKFSPCLINVDARFKATNNRQEVGSTTALVCGIKLKWQQHLNLVVATRRKGKVGRHHTDDGSGLGVDQDLFADDVTGAPKRSLPKAV